MHCIDNKMVEILIHIQLYTAQISWVSQKPTKLKASKVWFLKSYNSDWHFPGISHGMQNLNLDVQQCLSFRGFDKQLSWQFLFRAHKVLLFI